MKKLRVGTIGVGMGSVHIGDFQRDARVELAAVCDVNEERLLATAEKMKIPKDRLYTDAAEMFAKAKLDAVSIATPEQIPRAADAGRLQGRLPRPLREADGDDGEGSGGDAGRLEEGAQESDD